MTEVSNRLAKINGFDENARGVWQAAGSANTFNYSDGASSERALHGILSNASDLSSDSSELQASICDWPTEYHLSVSRTNLLRSLDLTGVKRILELGCGCGSITRFLGEQTGVEVDAVEGSHVRSALARLRCTGLDNVQISNANFNDIELPEAEYDLVLFVGVTEYAGRFSKAASDQEALNALLAMGKRACKKNGAVLVAIENRLGMKYALGACEDHYGLPFVGLDDYPQATGIRTYSKAEWLGHIAAVGFSQYRLMLPFPDYKIPTTVLRDDCPIEVVVPALSTVQSRDYAQAFAAGESLADNEGRLWQALAQAGTLAEHSNSFLWLLGDDSDRLEQLCKEPMVEFSQPGLNYPVPNTAAREMRPEDARTIEHLNAQITQLESHSSNLEGKVNLMSNSIGWKFLNGVRRLFRKTTL